MFSFHPFFHFHRYGAWVRNWSDSSFQHRSCEVCHKRKERFVY